MDVRLVARHTGRGHAVDCTNDRGITTSYDGSGGAHGQSPMEHLLGALGACALMDIHLILQKKRLPFQDLRVECEGTREERGEATPFVGMRLVFRVDGDVPEKAFRDAVRLSVEKYCSVGETLKAAPAVAWDARVG